MTIILIILIAIVLIIFTYELINIMIYGWPTKIKANLDNANLNSFRTSILMLPIGYISTVNSLFAKYYISDIGMVPRWSKFHKQIESKYQELLSE